MSTRSAPLVHTEERKQFSLFDLDVNSPNLVHTCGCELSIAVLLGKIWLGKA